MTLGVFHWSKDNRSGAEASIESFKTQNPGIDYFLVCDGGVSYADICSKYGVSYFHSKYNIGYPSSYGRGNWGYDSVHVELFLKRILLACRKLEVDHMVISEDDVICLNPIQYNPKFAIQSYWVTDGNLLHPKLLEYLTTDDFKPNQPHYGAGAGTIIDTQIFIHNYSEMNWYLTKHFDRHHKDYNYQLGWNDCFLTVFFYLAQKHYHENPRLHNIWPENPNTDLKELAKHYDMVHNYKNYYEDRKLKNV